MHLKNLVFLSSPGLKELKTLQCIGLLNNYVKYRGWVGLTVAFFVMLRDGKRGV